MREPKEGVTMSHASQAPFHGVGGYTHTHNNIYVYIRERDVYIHIYIYIRLPHEMGLERRVRVVIEFGTPFYSPIPGPLNRT